MQFEEITMTESMTPEIKPALELESTPKFSELEILQFIAAHYHLNGSLKALPGYCDQNLLLTTQDKQRFIVKIANNAEAKIELAMQNQAMVHLREKSAATPYVIANKAGQLLSSISNQQSQHFNLRVLSYIDGDFYADSAPENHNTVLWQHLGSFIGQLDLDLADFQHAGAYRYLEWDLAQGYGVCQVKKHLLLDEQSAIVEHFLTLYHNQTMPILPTLPMGIIHNDANDYNLLIDNTAQPARISGLIDFGDLAHTFLINELAVAIPYICFNKENPLEWASTLVKSYHTVLPLQEEEVKALYYLIAARLLITTQ
jgi:Ser/Thr protein kinase RdoA (MazF antagonist)